MFDFSPCVGGLHQFATASFQFCMQGHRNTSICGTQRRTLLQTGLLLVL
jgi:hypothetical protein